MGVGALWDEKWKGALYFFLFWFPLPGRTVRKGIFFVLISHLSTIFEWQECSWFSIRICFSLYIANICMTLMGWVMSSSLVKGLGVSGTLERVGSAVLKWVTHSQVWVLHGHCLLHSHFTSQLCKSDSWKCSKKWRGINGVIFADCYSLYVPTPLMDPDVLFIDHKMLASMRTYLFVSARWMFNSFSSQVVSF